MSVIHLCKNCPLRNVKKPIMKGSDRDLSFNPSQYKVCLECHMRNADKFLEDEKRKERLTVSPEKPK